MATPTLDFMAAQAAARAAVQAETDAKTDLILTYITVGHQQHANLTKFRDKLVHQLRNFIKKKKKSSVTNETFT